MVAIAIFSIVVASIYTTWTLVIRAAQSGENAAAQAQRERIAVRAIEDSLQCIQSFQASMAYYSFIVQNADSGEQPTFSYVSRVPAVFPRNGKFITGEHDFDVRRLTFTVESDKNDDQQKDLVLRQNPILMDMDADEQSYPLVLARNVKDFIVECWDTNQMEWVTEWDDTNSIPPIVRVTLSMGGDPSSTKAQMSVTREISIESSTVPSIVQTPRGQFGGGGGGPQFQVPGSAGGNPNGGNNQRGGNNNRGGNPGNFPGGPNRRGGGQ